jgi:putative ABC transport system permease protein
VFLVDISTEELAGVQALLAKQSGVRAPVETLPVISGRLRSIDGKDADALKLQNFPKHLLQSVTLTWSTGVPAGTKVHQGTWWQGSKGQGIDRQGLAISERLAKRLHLKLGSTVVFTSNERTIQTHVVATFANDGQHVYGRSEFILPPDALKGLPVVWYGAVRVDTPRIPEMQRALFAAYPTVTVINIADVLDTIQGVVRQITIIVRFLAGFSILSGAVILASSVASTRFRRVREVVVLKTLGARRRRVSAVFGVEFAVLGLLAGIVGAIFANGLSGVLLHKLDIVYRLQWTASVAAVLLTVVLAVVTGWLASFRMLGQKPLEVLREE